MIGTHAKRDFKKIWIDFNGKVKSFVSSRVKDKAAVDDIVQEIFIKIHRSTGGISDEARIAGWVFAIARNTITDYYRKSKEQTIGLAEDLPADDQTCDSVECDIAEGLYELVLSLPEKYSQVLLLTEFDGLSHAEVSQKLGITVSGVKSRVQRGRNLIRDSLLRCCHFVFDGYGTIIDAQPAVCCCCLQNSVQ